MQQRRINLSCDIIKEKERWFLITFGFPENHLKFSDIWINLFEKRNEFHAHHNHKENDTVNLDDLNVQTRIAEIHQEISAYALRDRYNMNKTISFYKISPTIIIIKESIKDHKKNKTRMIIAFTYNADEIDRFKSLYIDICNKIMML